MIGLFSSGSAYWGTWFSLFILGFILLYSLFIPEISFVLVPIFHIQLNISKQNLWNSVSYSPLIPFLYFLLVMSWIFTFLSVGLSSLFLSFHSTYHLGTCLSSLPPPALAYSWINPSQLEFFYRIKP